MASVSDTTQPQVFTLRVPSSNVSKHVADGTPSIVNTANGVRPGTMDTNGSILRTGSCATQPTLQVVHDSDVNSGSRMLQQGQDLVRRTNTDLVTVTNVSPATTVVNIGTLVDDGSADYVSYGEDLSQTSQGIESTVNDTGADIVGVSGDASHGLVTTVSHISQLVHRGGAGDAVIKRKRGRPPKHKLQEDSPETPNINSDATSSSPDAIGTVKRKRGRPPKRSIYIIRQESETHGASPGGNAEAEVVRVSKSTDESPAVKRRPGRPRKSESQMKPTHAGDGFSGRSTSPNSMAEPRASSRLASRRKSGYVAPWKALMRSSQEDEEEDEESSEGEDSEEEVVRKKSSVPVKGATPGKRGRGRPPRAAQPPPPPTPPPAPPVDVQQTLEEILQMDTGQPPEQIQEKPFSNAAVCVSRYTTERLAATDAGLDVVMGQLTAVLGLTWSVAGEQTHFLHGDLSTLLQAQQVLLQVCEGQSLEESFASQNLSIVTLIQATDETTEEPQPPDTTPPPEDREEENHIDENGDDEPVVEDEVLPQAADEDVSQDIDPVAIELATDQPEEHPEEEPEEPQVMINPATGERYSKTCAIYTNPEMATMTCDMCNFVTTEKGLLKHKMRKHPELVFECEICLEKFGVRYDMRRHRIQHFNQDGVLKATFEPSFRNRFPEFTGPITLGILESEFSVKEEEENGEPEQSEPSEKKETVPSKPKRLATLKAVKKIHMCDECDFQGPPASLSKHKIRNHPRFLYKCPKCPFELGELVDFLRHYTKHDDSTENVREINLEDLGDFCHCTACEHQGTEDDLILHVKTEHPHRLTCTRCDLVFLNQRMLQRHFRTEHRELYTLPSKNKKLQLPRDVSRCACEVCGQEVRLSWYHQHMKTHNRVTLRCHFCGFETWKRFAMKNHLLTKHGPKQFMCHICGQTFSYKSAHQNHIKNKHSDTPQVFPCPHCEKTFTVRRFMTTHVKRMHLKENKHFCDICGRGFFEKVKMKQHREVHAPAEHREATKQYQCGECGSRFRDRAKLLQHANIHSGERPFKCTTCNKSFTWKAELTKHQVSKHTEERPFRCTVCHKAFKFRYKLTTHMITHTRQSRHTCPTCGKAFTQRATLRKHRCRLPVYAADPSSGVTQSYVQIQGDTGHTEEIYIQLERPDGTSAVMGSDSLAQLEAAGADTEGGSVTFMCGMCQQLFSTAAEINDHVLTEHGESVTLVVESDSAEMNQIPEMNVHEVELEDAPDPEQVMAAGQLANQVNAHQIERCVEIHYSNEHEQLAESEQFSEEQFVHEEQATELLMHDDNTAEQQQVVQFEVVDGDVIEQGSEVVLMEETVLGSDEEQVVTVHMVEDLGVEEQLVEETGEQVMIVDETHTVDTVIE